MQHYFLSIFFAHENMKKTPVKWAYFSKNVEMFSTDQAAQLAQKSRAPYHKKHLNAGLGIWTGHICFLKNFMSIFRFNIPTVYCALRPTFNDGALTPRIKVI